MMSQSSTVSSFFLIVVCKGKAAVKDFHVKQIAIVIADRHCLLWLAPLYYLLFLCYSIQVDQRPAAVCCAKLSSIEV